MTHCVVIEPSLADTRNSTPQPRPKIFTDAYEASHPSATVNCRLKNLEPRVEPPCALVELLEDLEAVEDKLVAPRLIPVAEERKNVCNELACREIRRRQRAGDVGDDVRVVDRIICAMLAVKEDLEALDDLVFKINLDGFLGLLVVDFAERIAEDALALHFNEGAEPS